MKRLVPILVLLSLLGSCDQMITQRKAVLYSPAALTPRPAPDAIAWQDKSVAPPPLSLALLQRGQQRYRIFCTPCHSELGDGNGIVVQRAFPHPTAYTVGRLRHAPTRHFFDVITDGYGDMYSFAGRISPEDRWAIAAYIRALQLSQHAEVADLSAVRRQAPP
jgi:mono/diheme cytochrome c family protein